MDVSASAPAYWAARQLGLGINREADRVLFRLGLTPSQYDALVIYGSRDNLSNTDAAVIGNVTPQTLHTATKNLMEQGLISKATFPGIGRKFLINLTAEGRRVLGEANATMVKLDSDLAAELGPEAVAKMKGARDLLNAKNEA